MLGNSLFLSFPAFLAPYVVHVFHQSNTQPDGTTVAHSEAVASPNGDSGFSLQYTQLPCGQRFSFS